MVPLQTDSNIVWINRGFVPTGTASASLFQQDGVVVVEGLLRLAEPGGTLLEDNIPEQDRWVSRDVALMSADAGLGDTAPYFIDADHAGSADAWPRGGMTRIAFRNSHLVYAITWFSMAALFLAGMIYVIYDLRRSRQ